MFSKTKITLIAAVVLGSASAVLAQSGEEMQNSAYQRNPNAPVPLYAQSVQVPHARALIEGRNVGIRFVPSAQPIRDRFQGFGGY
jgi:hypothetical protein